MHPVFCVEALQKAIYPELNSDDFLTKHIIKGWMTLYNTERPHPALDRLTPNEVSWADLKSKKHHET